VLTVHASYDLLAIGPLSDRLSRLGDKLPVSDAEGALKCVCDFSRRCRAALQPVSCTFGGDAQHAVPLANTHALHWLILTANGLKTQHFSDRLRIFQDDDAM
jgi:hypothetical protein